MKRIPAVILVLLVGAACSRASAPAAGELRVIPLSGEVVVVDGEKRTTLEEATTVDSGVTLETGPTGRAQVEMTGGRVLELAPDASIHLDDEQSEVERGSVLVDTGPSDMRLRAGAAEIEATETTFRVDRATSVVLGVYSGEATVPTAAAVVPKLRQATILQNGDAVDLKPLVVERNDPWDIELLGNAIDLGLRLVSLERGLTRQLPRGDEVDAVSSVLEKSFPRPSIRDAILELGDAARAVVAAVVAQEIEKMNGGSRAHILEEVVELQAQAANWIVIVAQWSLAGVAQRVLGQLGDVAVAIAALVAPPPAPPSSDTNTIASGEDETGTGPSDPPDEGTVNPPDDNDPPRGGPKPKPPPEPPDRNEDGGNEPAPGCSNTVDCALDDVFDGP